MITDIVNHNLYSFIISQRTKLKNYIYRNPYFLISFEPVSIDDSSPKIVKLMAKASRKAGVGPMASVAGTISQLSLEYLIRKGSRQSIVDNGGDISLINKRKKVIVGLYAGDSPFSGKIGFKIKKNKKPLGICTSSGTVGHSISFGRADAVTVFAENASVADAIATSIGNYATGKKDDEALQNALDRADDLKEHFKGVLIIVGEHAGVVGKIPKLVATNKKVVLSELWEI